MALVVAVCLGAVVYASAHPSPWVFNLPSWHIAPFNLPSTQPIQLPQQEPGTANGHSSATWEYILLVLAILVGAAILFLIGRVLYRLIKTLVSTHLEAVPPTTVLPVGASLPGQPLTPDQVRDAVSEALARLDSAATSSDAIIAAWLALEDAALRHGLGRSPSATPTEFTANLLQESQVPEADTIGLRGIYLRTRFSDIPATDADVADARRWLRHIAATLEGTA